MKPADYYYLGFQDGTANKPRSKSVKGANRAFYENGYRAGSVARSQQGQQRKMRG